MINRLCIIGVGLIGGSLARALKAQGACGEIVGYGRDAERLDRAVELGVIDRYEMDMAAAVKNTDVVLLAVPVGSMQSIFEAMAPHIDATTVITDAGSTKASVVAAAKRAFGEVPANFVPGHPIAGTEKSGVEAAIDDLYRDRRVILTPLATTSATATDTVRRMWEAAGAQVELLEVKHHDEVLAATSHLPHMLAFALVDALAKMDEKAEVFRYAAGGFADFTRIASSDPTMWTDICLANREALLHAMRLFSDELGELGAAIEIGDVDRVRAIFERAKSARDGFCEKLNYAKE
jgi:prephenate dehydrogenase